MFMERGDPVSWKKQKHCFGFTSGKLAMHQLTCYWLKSRNWSFVSHLIKGPDWQWNVFWGIAKLHKCGSPWAWEWIMCLGSQFDFTMNESSSFCSIQRTTNCTEIFFICLLLLNTPVVPLIVHLRTFHHFIYKKLQPGNLLFEVSLAV